MLYAHNQFYTNKLLIEKNLNVCKYIDRFFVLAAIVNTIRWSERHCSTVFENLAFCVCVMYLPDILNCIFADFKTVHYIFNTFVLFIYKNFHI